MTPDVAVRIMRDNPELLMLVSERGDMFDPQQWGAILSPPQDDGTSVYRYLLWRVTDPTKPLLFVIMLNPSRATHEQGDRTIDGLMRRAAALGYGGLVVMNCFAYRATDPADMRRATDPVGPRNDNIIQAVLEQDVDLLCAWGVNAVHMDRERKVRCAISCGRARPHVLRLCASGAPEHPLYIPSALGLKPWSASSEDTGVEGIRSSPGR
jgi:hypothetical protein